EHESLLGAEPVEQGRVAHPELLRDLGGRHRGAAIEKAPPRGRNYLPVRHLPGPSGGLADGFRLLVVGLDSVHICSLFLSSKKEKAGDADADAEPPPTPCRKVSRSYTTSSPDADDSRIHPILTLRSVCARPHPACQPRGDVSHDPLSRAR